MMAVLLFVCVIVALAGALSPSKVNVNVSPALGSVAVTVISNCVPTMA
jgi:hypothetical protein